MKKTSLIVWALALGACSTQKEIVDIPIIFDEQRVELTKEYLFNRYKLEQDTPEITPKMVVLHWMKILR